MTFCITHSEFTAAEAARITEISQAEQRDWRKRNLLPPIEGGKAKFDAKLLAGMLVAKQLANLGIGPKSGGVLAKACGAMIYTRVMNRRQGVYDPRGLAVGPLVQSGPQSDVMARWAITDDGSMWGYADSPQELADQIGATSVVLDLDRLAKQLVERARKPLATIEAEYEASA